MDLDQVLEKRSKVEDFQRKHRIELLTLVFTDVIGSTELKHRVGEANAVSLVQGYRRTVRGLLERISQAEEIETAGDSFFIVFAKPSDAVRFALNLQAALRAAPTEGAIRNRIGIHVGEVFVEEHAGGSKPKDLYGLQVDICARITALGAADQILLSRVAFDSARQVLKGSDISGLSELSWLNHGLYSVKGVEEPLEVCEVGEIRGALLKAPVASDKGRPIRLNDGELVLGWRPAIDQVVPSTHWVLTEKLGEGGFGEVWLTRHSVTKEKRTFKFCFRAERVRALRREVTLFRLLKERAGEHPNIVRLLDVSFEAPPFYLELEYVEGRDLRSWATAENLGQMPLSTRVEIIAQVADGLAAAHRAGVVHRDIKPTNILVTGPPSPNARPTAKLTDFGVGQVLSAELLSGRTAQGFTQTISSENGSTRTGTLLYLAPELLASRPADERSDIYALGVVLYQFVVGDFARAVTADWRDDIEDAGLRRILARCLARSPEKRFGTGEEFAAALRSLKKNAAKRNLLISVAGAVPAALLGFLLFCSPLRTPLLYESYNWTFKPRPAEPIDEVLLVYMDEDSRSSLGQSFREPWDRRLHAKLVERLTAAGAKAIVFDVVFDDPSREGTSELAAAFARAPRIVLAADRSQSGLIPPAETLWQAATNVGTSEVLVDRDLVVRMHSAGGAPFPALAEASYLAVRGTLPAKQRGQRIVKYYGEPFSLPYMSYFRAFDSGFDLEKHASNRVVFVGAGVMKMSGIPSDAYAAPFRGLNAQLPLISGLEIQATMFLNLLRGDWIRRIPLRIEAIALVIGILGFSLAVSYAMARFGIRKAAFVALPVSVAIILVSFFFASRLNYWLPWMVFIALQLPVSLAFSLLLRAVHRYQVLLDDV